MVKCFLRRHPDLTNRFGENIKRKRAEVDWNTINSYFDNLEKSLEGIPPEGIINYDEAAFTDDPGSVKVLVRRGTKHPERVIDFSKTSTSVMFAVTASGHLLPPYVVYKAKNLYDVWTENGYEGSRYNHSQSGWFDMDLFQEWFITIALPYFKKLPPGKKALVGDNLASHLSVEVLQQCLANDIKFILLPPNSTHLLQPLDKTYFRPLKQPEMGDIEDKDFVLVKIKTDEGRRREKFYVGQIVTDVDEQMFEVTFLRKKATKDLHFVFPNVPDVTNVIKDDIVRKLIVKNFQRQRYYFKDFADFPALF